MSENATSPTRKPGGRRPARSRLLLIVGGVILALIVGRFLLERYTDVLWFSQLGFVSVFWRSVLYSILTWIVFFLLTFIPVFLTMRVIMRRGFSEYSTPALASYQKSFSRMQKPLLWALPLVLGFLSASAIATRWNVFALAFSAKPFGSQDPVFGMDASFYVMVLPALLLVAGTLTSISVLCLVIAVIGNYLFGHIAIRPQRLFISRPVRYQVTITAAVLLLVAGARLWLGRYQVLTQANGSWAGGLYTDVNARIPTQAIMAAACIIVAVCFVIAARTQRWKLPVVGLAALLLTGIVAGAIYPWGVQKFVVTPSAQSRESQFIKYNIDATRSAFGLDKIKVQPYDATTKASAGALSADKASVENVRLLDPNVVSNAFAQLQQYRPYYQFPERLNVDRYEVEGKKQDTVIAVRELNIAGTPDSWFNRHIVYTHGYGVVAAYGSKVGADGKPVFMQSGIPSTGKISGDGQYEPRVYFGEKSPDYSIVGGPEGAAAQEIDRPQNTDESAAESKTTFRGQGGPGLGNPINRLAYALKFSSANILLSNGVNAQSQILYDRDPRDRVSKVAPYLTVDDNAYPAVVDGRIKWIVDAYTVSNQFPYSTPTQLKGATTDRNSNGEVRQGLPNENVNYMRNSVKATVDAYDGSVTLYAWDEDPVLSAWKSVYPGTVKDKSEMSAQLMSHVRYPQDQFKVQREMLGKYHVTDAGRLFNGDDAWAVPNDPTTQAKVLQPPYYMSLKLPGQKDAAFSLTSPFISNNVRDGQQRDVMYGFLSANGDAGQSAGKVDPGYGTLTLLELPRDSVVPGPGQAQTKFSSDPRVSTELNLLRSGASEVISGNLLSLPAGDGILYVQPVYVQATSGIKMPTLRRVLVSFGDKVGFAPTLDEALNQVFEGNAGTSSGSAPAQPQKPAQKKPPKNPALKEALDRASAAIKQGQDALSKSDFTAYGKSQEELKKALNDAMKAEEEGNK